MRESRSACARLPALPVVASITAALSSLSCVQDRRLKLSEPTLAHQSSITQTLAWT